MKFQENLEAFNDQQTLNVMNNKLLFFNAFASRPRPSANKIVRSVVSKYESDKLQKLLSEKTSMELTAYDLVNIVESNLWMLTPEAFIYFLPSFMQISLESYASVSVFASEFIGTLTKPFRTDAGDALNQVDQFSAKFGLANDMTELLLKQQFELFDSGIPTAIFCERFDNITKDEGAAILDFLFSFQKRHGVNFPFDELKIAIDRHWIRYRISSDGECDVK
jgi:hypothetical protein